MVIVEASKRLRYHGYVLKNVFITGVGNFINAVGGFLFLAAATKALSVEQFGLYSLLIATFLLLAKITELGTTSSFVTLSIKDDRDYTKALFLLKTLLTALMLLVLIPILLFYNLLTPSIFLACVVGLIGYAFNDFLFAQFQLRENFVLAAATNMLPALVKAAAALLILLGVVSGSFTLIIYLYFFALLASLLTAPFAKKRSSSILPTQVGIKNLAIMGFPGGISQTINIGIPAINNNLINAFGSLANVGIFSLAEKLSSIFILASYTLFTVFLPKGAKETKTLGKYNFKQAFYLSLLIVAAMVVMIAVAKPVIQHIFGAKFESSIAVLYLMVIAAGISAITSFMDNYFYIVEKTYIALAINCSRLLVLAGASFILIARSGILGAALANIIAAATSLAITLITIIFLNRQTNSQNF